MRPAVEDELVVTARPAGIAPLSTVARVRLEQRLQVVRPPRPVKRHLETLFTLLAAGVAFSLKGGFPPKPLEEGEACGPPF